MKYLKLYEDIDNEFSINDYLDQEFGVDRTIKSQYFTIRSGQITSLIGLNRISNIRELNIGECNLITLKGIEDATDIEKACLFRNNLTSLEGIGYLIKLEYLSLINNRLTNLNGIENLMKLRDLAIYGNKLKNLDEIKNLKLFRLAATYLDYGNDYDEPIPIKYYENIPVCDIYCQINDKFSTYEYQKEFLDETPERLLDLVPLGLNSKIKEEYKDLISFFDLKKYKKYETS